MTASTNEPVTTKSSGDTDSRLLRHALLGFIVALELLVLCLMVRELIESEFRATNTVLTLIGVLFLPVVLDALRRFIVGSSAINLRAGDLEIKIQGIVDRKVQKTEAHFDEKLDKKAKAIVHSFEGKLSTAEQTLYPLIGGPDAFSGERLAEGRVIIGSKDFAGNIVVAELLAQHLERYGIRCERKIPNGGTLTNYAELMNGWIDLFVDYTGTGCLFLNVPFRNRSREAILQSLNELSQQRFGFCWASPLGTQTDYCLVMRRDVADEKKIRNISDLSVRHRGTLRFCGNYEFMNRLDGLPGLKRLYDLRFSDEDVVAYGERYAQLKNGFTDVTIGHTTDPDVNADELRQLVDDKGFFPAYYETPLVRTQALVDIQALQQALDDFPRLGVSNAELTALIQDYNEQPVSLTESVRALLARHANVNPMTV